MSPLEPLSIVEIGDDVAVRYCGRLFAALGAQVIRLERACGDDRRGQGGTAGQAYGAWLDGSKIVGKPAASVDLVIAGQTGVDTRRGDGVAQDCSASLLRLLWFDPAGPYGGWRGGDGVIRALTGVAFGFGKPEGPPILAQGHGPQVVGGLTAFVAAMAGMMSKPRPGLIDVNILEANLCFTEPGAIAAAGTDLKSTRLGPNRLAPTYPNQVYRTADSWAGVTALTPAQWAALAGLIGRPDLGREPRFAAALQRLAAADEIDAILAPIFAERDTAYWVEAGMRLRIPITPAPSPGEIPRHEHWRSRQAFAPLADLPADVHAPTLPFRFAFDGVSAPRPSGPVQAPLTGVTVGDFSMGWAGPLGARLLADLGAEVLKVESSVRPDWFRGWEAPEPSDPPLTEIALNFLAMNRGKLGLDLDLTTPAGKVAAQAVIAASDVVIENLGPGVMAGLGLGADEQRRLAPGIISLAMPPFGAGGPLSGLRAYGSTVEQASGMPFVNGFPDWPPCLQHVAYGDPVAAYFAAAAVLIALYARDRLGGAAVDLCQVECLFQLGADAIIGEQVRSAPSVRAGSRRATAAPCCVVPGAGEDAWLALVVEDDVAWRSLCDVLARPDLAGLGLRERSSAVDAIETAIGDWARDKSPAAAARQLQARGVAAAPVSPAHGLTTDPQLVHAGYFARQHRRHVGDHLTPQTPFRFDGARPPLRAPGPILGEHTQEVLARLVPSPHEEKARAALA